jgi:hypothetical protein
VSNSAKKQRQRWKHRFRVQDHVSMSYMWKI